MDGRDNSSYDTPHFSHVTKVYASVGHEVKPYRRSRRRPAASFLHSWQQLVVGSILVTGTSAYRTLDRLLRIKCSRKLASIYTLFALAAPWHPSGRQTCVVVTVVVVVFSH